MSINSNRAPRKVFRMALLGIACIPWLLIALVSIAGMGSRWRGTVQDASKIPYGGEVIALLAPTGDLVADSSYSPHRSHMSAEAIGTCEEESFNRFVSDFQLQTFLETGDMYNDEIALLLGKESRDILLFSRKDQAFYGGLDRGERSWKVVGVYNHEMRRFYIKALSFGMSVD